MSNLLEKLLLVFYSLTIFCIHGEPAGRSILYFNSGSDVNLTCGNNTWDEKTRMVWTMSLRYSNCIIIRIPGSSGQIIDTCKDGKSLRNTSSTQPYLHIPNLSLYDEGYYECELHKEGTSETFQYFTVEIMAPPSISSWLEREDNKMVAVCKAERGKPAANISWSHRAKSLRPEELNFMSSFITAESRLELDEGMDTETLSCTISHPYWTEEKILVPKLQTGTNNSASVNSPDIAVHSYVFRHSAIKLGSDANLTCGSTIWNNTLLASWSLHLKYKECEIFPYSLRQSSDPCKDGKSLQNTIRGQPYLHIPNFSHDDVGVYNCLHGTMIYIERHEINVSIIAPPSISSWSEREDNKMVAVCKAERGKPAATISWSHRGNSSTVETSLESNDLFTVESRLELDEGMETETLSCTISHPYWTDDQILVLNLREGHVSWLRILIVVIFVLLIGFIFFCSKDNHSEAVPAGQHTDRAPTGRGTLIQPEIRNCSAIYWWRSQHSPSS